MNRKLLIKICGLKTRSNIEEVIALHPDFIGFILYPGSPRYVHLETAGQLVKMIPQTIKKVGVLVNEPFENALKIAQSGVFDLLQLHGNETPEYCLKLSFRIKIIKTFSVSDTLPAHMAGYQEFCEMFLFDNAGEKHGGTGKSFNHSILRDYLLDKDFFLSGGIAPDDSTYIKSINHNRLAALDLNSRFESEPGIKNIRLLKEFIEKIREYDTHD